MVSDTRNKLHAHKQAANTLSHPLKSSPPSHASLPSDHEQSMRFCWLKAVSTPVARNTCPSVVPVAPKDQQDPHAPWSLGGVTAPRSRQSMPPGSSFTGPWEPASAGPNRRSCVRVAGTVKPSGVCSLPFRFAAFSSRVQSANEFSSSQNPRRLRFMEFTYRSALRNSAPRIATESAVKPPVPVEAAAAAVVVARSPACTE
mmetsp:Transcript_47286/g.80616  ORF Transcript_47286/g.80616 Transcript_47286/m.80616 type:complete len:201 (-) Transcript_47286:967-1569(-)